MKKLALTTAILAGAVAAVPAFADGGEKQIKPSDPTQVNTLASIGWENASNIDANGNKNRQRGATLDLTVAGNGFLFMGETRYVESSDTKKSGFGDTRGRLFGMMPVNWGPISVIGASADLIRGGNDAKGLGSGIDTAALGVIAKIDTPWEQFSIYPNLAAAQMEDERRNKVGGDFGTDKGYQANLFLSYDISDRMYLMAMPQYSNMDKNGESVKFGLTAGYALTADLKHWVTLNAETNYNKDGSNWHRVGSSLGGGKYVPGQEDKISVKYSYYF